MHIFAIVHCYNHTVDKLTCPHQIKVPYQWEQFNAVGGGPQLTLFVVHFTTDDTVLNQNFVLGKL
jgi:hypothetical protein